MPQYSSVGYEVLEDYHYQTLENVEQTDSNYQIYGYEENKAKKAFYYLVNFLFLGIPALLCLWSCKFLALCKYSKCNLCDATSILVYDKNVGYSIQEVTTDLIKLPKRLIRSSYHTQGENVSAVQDTTHILIQLRYFFYQHTKYCWVRERAGFGTLSDFLPPATLENVLKNTRGLQECESQELLKFYGHNQIIIEIKSYWKLFVEEILNPFYIFQIFSVILWSFDDYYVYAGCVLFLLLTSAVTSLYETRKLSIAIHDVIKSDCVPVEVLLAQENSDPIIVTKHPYDLVPGDVILIPRIGCLMSCDAVLLTGLCMVNESSLTGESVPVTKTPPHSSSEPYNANTHKRHTLFAGTNVVQARYYGGEHVLAQVVRTGFDTTKGSLVKSILFPTPVGLKFYKDSLKFLLMLGGLATIGMGYCMYLYISRGVKYKFVILRALDIFTILVPPALPAAMTIGIAYSQNRLKKKGIYCISPQRINTCGKLKLACFDKTGTLTNEGLDLFCVIPIGYGYEGTPLNMNQLNPKSPFMQGLATCHSLTSINGKLIGDPLDLTMFEGTSWVLEEPGSAEEVRYDLLAPTVVKPKGSQLAAGDTGTPYELGIVQQFAFSSTQQCMSVIVRELGAPNMTVFCKGAPEKIITMCNSDSIPENFYIKLSKYTTEGYRMIAVAYKELPEKFKWKDAQTVKRNLIECDLNFLGFIVMKNSLKPETTPVIDQLHKAKIRTVMITGDNIMTAISVARDCHMIQSDEDVIILKTKILDDATQIPKLILEGVGTTVDVDSVDFNATDLHFAIDGKTWEDLYVHFYDLLANVLMKTTVYARFQPDQKAQLIMHLQELDYIVSMVGDGANDCGALKAAHVGVSLSQAEASVAAPFTSSVEDISCITNLMLEGRCALVTSFATFKYMALYSLIQFFSVIILYKHYSILGDTQFLFIDLIITTCLAITIGRQGPSTKLVPKRPMGSLIAPKNIIPMILQIVLCGGLQLTALYFLFKQHWFKPIEPGKEEIITCWENSVIFLVSSFQYVVLALLYSKGKPYRESLIVNFWLIISSAILVSFLVFLCVHPVKVIAEFLEVLPLSHNEELHVFRYQLLLFPLCHVIVATVIELSLAETAWFSRFLHFVSRKTRPKNRFKRIRFDGDFKNYFSSENDLKRNTANP